MRHVSLRACATAACMVLYGSTALAVSYSLVPVGNPGNAADTAPAGRGAVGYHYQIGKYEVTNAQYVEFLNAVDPTGGNSLGLYAGTMTTGVMGGINFDSNAANGSKYSVKPNGSMTISSVNYTITYGNKPVNYVSVPDAMRFANWMHNGQGAGGTETGAYTMSSPFPPARNANATFALPTVDEFHKAAYYDPNTAVYYNYATGSDSLPGNPQPPSLSGGTDPGMSANYRNGGTTATAPFAVTQLTGSADPTVNYLSDVGDYANSPSLYGTFDQSGNVQEMMHNAATMVAGGGAYSSTNTATAFGASATFIGLNATLESVAVGFRLVVVPEPASASLLALAGMGILRRRARA